MRTNLDNVGIREKEVYFHLDFEDKSQKAKDRIVPDGEIKYADLDFIVFPGISICIPIVVLNDKGEVLSAIHAAPNWTTERLSRVIELLIKRNGATRVEYAERVNPASIRALGILVQEDHSKRLAILNWLKDNSLNIPFYRKEIVAEGMIDHIGYKKKMGFQKIQFS